jgi:hypothetical protein
MALPTLHSVTLHNQVFRPVKLPVYYSTTYYMRTSVCVILGFRRGWK